MTEGALSMAGGHQSVDAREGEAAAGGAWGAQSQDVGPPRAERGAAGPQIAAAYRQGLGIEAIARRAGLPVREVYWLLGRENVAIRPARVARGTKPDTIELLRRIRRMRAEGFTYKQIGRTCGIAPGTVGVMLSTFREVEL